MALLVVSVALLPAHKLGEEAAIVVVKAAVGWLTVAASVLVQPEASLMVTV